MRSRGRRWTPSVTAFLLVAPGQGTRTRAGSRIAGAVDRTRTLASNPTPFEARLARSSPPHRHALRNGTLPLTVVLVVPYCNIVTFTVTPLHSPRSLRLERHGTVGRA